MKLMTKLLIADRDHQMQSRIKYLQNKRKFSVRLMRG